MATLYKVNVLLLRYFFCSDSSVVPTFPRLAPTKVCLPIVNSSLSEKHCPIFPTRSFEQNVYAHEGKTFLSRAQTFILVSANLFHREKKVGGRYCDARKVHCPRFESESAAIKVKLAASRQAPAATAAAGCEARSLRRQTPRHTLYIIYRPAEMINDHRAERKPTTGKSLRSGRLHGQNLRDATPTESCAEKARSGGR